jgi:UPF0271 protein
MKKYSINCDMGEGIVNETAIMPYIDYCNVACGGHTGNFTSMSNTIALALKNKVKIGAHPSYPDKINFGRKSIEISNDALIKSIKNQINNLIEIAKISNSELVHIKPHGALYNDIVKNKELAQVFITAILPYKSTMKLFVPYKSEIEKIAVKSNFDIVYEVFADRNYNQDLSLVSRSKSNAVIEDLSRVIKRIKAIILTGKVTTVLDTKVSIKAETFCVHSDTNNAEEFVKGIHELIIKCCDE